MQDFRPTLLHHVLSIVPFEGWSAHCLRDAAEQAGISPAEAASAFPGGIHDCLRYYFSQIDESVKAEHTKESLAKMRVPQRIETLIMARFRLMHPHREAVKQAASSGLLPWNALETVQSLFRMTDWIWRLAGDRATDYNYYTKRMTLAGVYVPTFLFWVNDDSHNNTATQNFLQNQLKCVSEISKKKKNILSDINVFSYYKKR